MNEDKEISEKDVAEAILKAIERDRLENPSLWQGLEEELDFFKSKPSPAPPGISFPYMTSVGWVCPVCGLGCSPSSTHCFRCANNPPVKQTNTTDD